MDNGSEGTQRSLEQLSALADGELDAASTASVSAHWRVDAQTRSSWHAYHLIGDVLRSEELASDPARDIAFLNRLHQRLALEPAVLAPQGHTSAADMSAQAHLAGGGQIPRGTRWAWLAPMAVAASFMAVASVLVVTRMSTPRPDTAVAQASPGRAGGEASVPLFNASASGDEGFVAPQTLVASGELVRDPRLERYLDAHKQFGGTSALGVPSGFLRSATIQAADR